MMQSTREENIAKAKDDFKAFLHSMFKFIKPKASWGWLGFSDKDAFRMDNISDFTKELVKDAVSLKSDTYQILNFYQPILYLSWTGIERREPSIYRIKKGFC